MLSALLSSSCTAPFLGTAMSFALSSSYIYIFLVFLAIAIGFSTPYLMIIIFPNMFLFGCKLQKWSHIIKKLMILLLCCTLLWLLSILYTRIGLVPAITLFLLLLLLKFVLENSNYFLQYNFIKILIILIIIAFCLYLPIYSYKKDIQHERQIDHIWQNFQPEMIETHLKNGKIVIVDISADWCVSCKFNKIMVWDRERTLSLLRGSDIIAMRGDFTNYDPAIYKFLSTQNIYGIPHSVIYSPNGCKQMLPVILSYQKLVEAIIKMRINQ